MQRVFVCHKGRLKNADFVFILRRYNSDSFTGMSIFPCPNSVGLSTECLNEHTQLVHVTVHILRL